MGIDGITYKNGTSTPANARSVESFSQTLETPLQSPSETTRDYWSDKYRRRIENEELDEIKLGLCDFFETLIDWKRRARP